MELWSVEEQGGIGKVHRAKGKILNTQRGCIKNFQLLSGRAHNLLSQYSLGDSGGHK